MSSVIFTIVSNNYLHFARTLMQSVARHEPACDRVCILVDEDASQAASFGDEFSLIRIDELRLPRQRRFTFQYTILELNTAVKPWVFALLFERGYDDVVYLDPDISLYRPLTSVFERLSCDADVVLTPHLLAPTTDERLPSELDIRRAGTYNLGFCAMTRCANAKAVVAWWQSKLHDRCEVDFEAGVFVDQAWMDLLPGLFSRVAILRDPGYNVAYWNLAQRPLFFGATGWVVAGEWPLVFFHFSGFDPLDPTPFSRHQNRFELETLGRTRALVIDYAERVVANGASQIRHLPYTYECFDDRTTRIPDLLRRRYRKDEALQRRLGDDPFAHPSIVSTAMPATRPGHLSPTYAMQALWNERPDLQEAFPMTDDDSIARYYDWFVNGCQHEFSMEVVAAHAAVLASIIEMFGLPAYAVAYETSHSQAEREARERIVEHLFVALLDREPDPVARRHFANRLREPAGSWRVLMALGLSRESRAREAMIGRLARGARQVVGRWILGTEPRLLGRPKEPPIRRSVDLDTPRG